MSKILILNGSLRRNGNVSHLTAKALEGIRAAGSVGEEIFLSSLKIHPCTACESCAKIDSYCVFEDDMIEVCRKMAVANAIIFASPIYWFNVSAQMKLAIDRIFGMYMKNNNFFRGKSMGLIFCYGDKEAMTSGVINAYNSFRDIAAYTGASITGVVQGAAWQAGEVAGNAQLLQEAYTLGAELVKTSQK